MARRRQQRDPYTKDPRDPLELLGRFLVSSSYRVPVEGTGTKAGLQAIDVAGAVGYMEDPLASSVAVAVATRAEKRELARVAAAAYRRVARTLRMLRPQPLKLSSPADRWRLRMVIYDATTELVWPERRRPKRDLAKATKMRLATYCDVHKVATAELQAALNEGREDFSARLWAMNARECW